MFSFLKKAARAASLGASNLNIAMNTHALLTVANEVQEKQDAAGGAAEAADGQRVHGAQKRLFDDMGIAISNGMTPEQVLETIKKAAGQHDRVSTGAATALEHVVRSAFPIRQ